MSSLILPSRRIVQPAGLAEVDWSNPLTRGLVSAGTAAGKLDVVRRVPARSHIYEASRHGIVAPNNATWPPVNFDANYVSIPANSGFTVIVVVPAAALVGSNPGVMRSGSYAAYGAGIGSTFCIVQGSGSNRPWVRLNGTDILKPGSGEQLVVGGEYVLAYSVASASSAKVAWNGAIRHQTTHSTTTPSFSIYGLGAQSAAGESIGGLSAFAIYDRALNDKELIEVTRTGWQIFKPVTRRIYFDVGAGSGLSVNATLATADASGNTATVDRQLAITASQAAASASGYAAGISFGLTVSATQATADAGGYLAGIDRHLDVVATTGTASASGYDASIQFGSDLNIAASYGLASADGYQAAINLQAAINAMAATASASGYDAAIVSGGLSLTAADLAAIDALIVSRLADIAAATLAAATAAGGIDSNLQQILGAPFSGSGTEADPWGP